MVLVKYWSIEMSGNSTFVSYINHWCGSGCDKVTSRWFQGTVRKQATGTYSVSCVHILRFLHAMLGCSTTVHATRKGCVFRVRASFVVGNDKQKTKIFVAIMSKMTSCVVHMPFHTWLVSESVICPFTVIICCQCTKV